MDKDKLDAEEKAILNAFEKGEYQSTLTPARRHSLSQVAEDYARKDINIKESSFLSLVEKQKIIDDAINSGVSTLLIKEIKNKVLKENCLA